MARRTVLAAAAVALGVTFGLTGTAAAFGMPVVDLEREVEYPINTPEYPVLTVDGPHVRNPSCSIGRGFRNDTDIPLFVTARMEWDGQEGAPVFPRVGDSAYTEAEWVQPGGRVFAVWDHGFIPNGPVRLLITAQIDPPVDIGVNFVEFVPACRPESAVTTTTAPPVVTVPTVETTVPVTATTVPDTTLPSEPGPPFEAATTTTAAATEVLTSTTARSLPPTGASTGDRLMVAAVLALSGLVLVGAARQMRGRS